jgi:hypothetical protein
MKKVDAGKPTPTVEGLGIDLAHWCCRGQVGLPVLLGPAFRIELSA